MPRPRLLPPHACLLDSCGFRLQPTPPHPTVSGGTHPPSLQPTRLPQNGPFHRTCLLSALCHVRQYSSRHPLAANTHRRHRTFLAAVLLSAAASADAIVALGSYAPVASSATTAISTASSALPEDTNLLSALLNPTAAAAGAQAAGAWEAVAASTAANLAVGAAATMMGLVGCCVAHQLVNGNVEKRASESGVAAAGGQGPGGQRTEGGWWSRYVAAEGVLAGAALQLAATTAGGVGVAATAAALGAGFSAGW